MDSVFNDLSTIAEFTSHDRFILNLLYREEIKPGMRWRKVEPLLPRLLAQVRRGLAPAADDARPERLVRLFTPPNLP